MASQFHPEFKSRPERPHPLFDGFVAASLAVRDGREPVFAARPIEGSDPRDVHETPSRVRPERLTRRLLTRDVTRPSRDGLLPCMRAVGED